MTTKTTKLPNSNSVDNFESLDTPGDPGDVKVVELSGIKPKSADSVTVIYNVVIQC